MSIDEFRCKVMLLLAAIGSDGPTADQWAHILAMIAKVEDRGTGRTVVIEKYGQPYPALFYMRPEGYA